MMGKRSEVQSVLFHEFDLEGYVPQDHLVWSIDRFVDLDEMRRYLASFHSAIGRPSFDPELMMRMLLVGDTGYGGAEMMGWLVWDQGMEPHIPVLDKSRRRNGTFSRSHFQYDHEQDAYRCPGGNLLHQYRRQINRSFEPGETVPKADNQCHDWFTVLLRCYH